jgi:hypothetical protein
MICTITKGKKKETVKGKDERKDISCLETDFFRTVFVTVGKEYVIKRILFV